MLRFLPDIPVFQRKSVVHRVDVRHPGVNRPHGNKVVLGRAEGDPDADADDELEGEVIEEEEEPTAEVDGGDGRKVEELKGDSSLRCA